ncbi:hypothetical protein CCR75_004653 [Bremia lactucae]|uniref:Peptidase S1 domain-containing protein n=1 Tax=Bremia lactucae TaxID=4779 RepID=A0A976FR54_BRELC|nr:hypothetical protein CCR75_004653 [Bremia lactucae]
MKFILLISPLLSLVRSFSFERADESQALVGTNTKAEKYGYVAAIHFEGPESKAYCAGTLIAPRFVLTSSLCLLTSMHDVYVSLGSTLRPRGDTHEFESIRVVRSFVHPLMTLEEGDLTPEHDVGIFMLATSSKNQPANLPAAKGSVGKPGAMATTFDWNYQDGKQDFHSLNAETTKVIRNDKCSQIYDDVNQTTVEHYVICTGNANCKGNMGSPLVVNGTIAGVMTTGLGIEKCGKVPPLFARVSIELEFIDEVLNGGDPGEMTSLLTDGTGFPLEDLFQI